MDSNMKSSSKSEAVISENFSDSDGEINFDDLKDFVDDEDNEGGNNVIVFNCESRVEPRNSSEVFERESSPGWEDSVANLRSPECEVPTTLLRSDLSVKDESMTSPVSSSTADKEKSFKTTKKKDQQPKKKNCKETSVITKNSTSKSKAVEPEPVVKKSNVFEPKPVESKTSFDNSSKNKSKLVELESKVKETKISSPVNQLKVILERLDLSRYRIGNSDRFSSHPISNSIQKSAPANDKNPSNRLEVLQQKDIEKAVLIQTLKSSDQNNCPQIKVKPLKIKNTQKESNNCLEEVVNSEDLSVVNGENPFKIKVIKQPVGLNKRPIVEEVPIFQTKSLISSTNLYIDQSTRDIPPSRSVDSNVGDKEKPSKAVKRRRISDTNISSPSVKLKPIPEDLAAKRERLTPMTELTNDVVDRRLKIDPKENSKKKTKEVVGNEIPSNAVELKSSNLREVEDDLSVKEQLVEKIEPKGASKKLKSKTVLDDNIKRKKCKFSIDLSESLINQPLTKNISLDNKADNCKENRLEINSNKGETGESKLKVDLGPHFDFATEASEFLIKDSCDEYKVDLDGIFKILDDETVEDDEQVIERLLEELLIKVHRLTINNGQIVTTRDKSHSIKGAEISAAKLSVPVESVPVVSECERVPSTSISNNILAKGAEEVLSSSLCKSVGENSAIIEGAATKICDSIIKNTTLVLKCEQARTSKWYHPVANLTKSERRLRKIKRGHGMSTEFKKNMKFLLRRNPQQYLIEVIQLHKLSEAKILKLSRCKSTSNFPPKLQTQFSRNVSLISRPKDSSAALVDSTLSQRRSSKGENISAKFREDKSHISAMKKADLVLAKRLSHLPRIPKKTRVINSDLNTPKISSHVIEKVSESKCASPLSNLKSSMAMESKANDSSKRKPIEEVLLKVVTPKCTRNSLDDNNRLAKYVSTGLKTGNVWDELELDDFLKIREKHSSDQNIVSKLTRINNLVKNNSASSVRKPYNPFCGILDLPTNTDANIAASKPSTDKPMDDIPTNDELLPTLYCADSLSVDPQVSDDETSAPTPFDDSSISSDEDVSICSRSNVLMVPKCNYWLETYEVTILQDTSHFYRYEVLESLASGDTLDDTWSDQCEAEIKIYDESNKRHSFDQELSKMNPKELEKKMNLSFLADNFKKCLTVFEHYKKKSISDVPILFIDKLFVIARKCINCSQEDTILFLGIIGDCISPKENLSEKIKILAALFNWLNTVNRATKGSHWTAIGRQVGFSNLVSLFNQALAEAINTKQRDLIISLYRAGSGLHLPMDASVIRALVNLFLSPKMLDACPDAYNLGCQFGVYNCLKIRRWPMVLFIKSYYTVEEIRIVLLEFLIKLDKLLSTKFFVDLGVNFNEDLSLFIRFEELKFEDFSIAGINSLASIQTSLSDVFERFKMALSLMGESILDNVQVDQKRTILRLEKPLLEKLLKYPKVHAQNMKAFIDHDKPRLFNALAYQQLTANGIYSQYDENPFI